MAKDLAATPCPRAADHTPAPNGYIAWHEWAAAMYYRGWRQYRCDGCGLYLIWHGGRDLIGRPDIRPKSEGETP